MKKTNKTLVRLITSIALGIVACSCMLLYTFAWFTINSGVVQASGLQMKAIVVPTLIISDDVDTIQSTNINSISSHNGGKYNVIKSKLESQKISVCTHDNDYDTYTTGLKYVTNPSSVDFVTGLHSDGTDDLAYSIASNGTDKFYIDYTVYIASHGIEMENASLVGYVDSAKLATSKNEVTSGSLMATSVDFYLQSVTKDSYLGTSNVATKEKVSIVSNGLIPHNTDDSLCIIMRLYFDGALTPKNDSSRAYINAASLCLDKVSINVKFDAVDNND